MRTTSIFCISVALLAAGCGSSKPTSGPPSDCELRAENAAASAVLKRAYDAGKLGSAAALAKHFKGEPRSAYLRPDGTLRPLGEVKGAARFDYEVWMNAEVGASDTPTGNAMHEARLRVRDNSPCKELIQ